MDPQRMYGNLHQLPEAKWKQDSVPTSKEDDGFYTNFMKPQSDGNWNQQEGRSRRHPKSIEPTRVQVSAAPPRPPKAGQNISLIDTWPSGTPTIGLDIYSPAVEAAFRSPASPEPPSTTKTGGARRTVLVLIALLGTFIVACIGLVALVLTNNAKFSEELKMLRVELSENSSHVSKDMTDFKKQQNRINSDTDQSLRELKKDMVSKDMTGFKKQQDQINSDTDQSLQELKKKIESICLTCPVEWKWFQKSCYFFSSTARNWESARQFCLNHGSHLVIVNDREEQKFLDANCKNRPHWIGFSDAGKEREWRWVDGSPATFSFWNEGEPNDINSEDCAETHPTRKWNDLRCETNNLWICEKDWVC